jgi:hypothetical protein
MDGESKVTRARQHVRDGERHVTDQRERLERLKEAGADVASAQELLGVFEHLLELHRQHLEAIERTPRRQ